MEHDYRVVTGYDDPYIEHFGVKGMKWGIRKDKKNAKPKKTYEVKEPSKAKVALAIMFPFVSVPILLASESIKRSKDPTYAKRVEEYMAKNRSKNASTFVQDNLQRQQNIDNIIRFHEQMRRDSINSMNSLNEFTNQATMNNINQLMMFR